MSPYAFIMSMIVLLGTAGSAFSETLSGRYIFPVSVEIASFANFRLSNPVWESLADGRKRLHYTLPPELDGPNPARIHLEGRTSSTGGMLQMTGQGHRGSCLKTGFTIACLIEINPNHLSVGTVADYLERKYREDPISLRKRKFVAESFQREPIGVVTVDLR